MGALDQVLGTTTPAPDALAQAVSAPEEPRSLPGAGFLPGRVYLNPKLAPVVPDGAPRPFAPGEYVENPDKSWSSEISMTVAHPDLNGGKPTNIPSLWIVNGKPYRAKNEDEAAALAVRSALEWPTYPDIESADKAAADREAKWQGIKPKDAAAIPPLWNPRKPK